MQPSVYILLHSPLPVLKHRRPPFETRLATRLDWPSLPVAYRALPCRQTIGLHLKHCAFLPSCPQHHSQSCLPPKPAIQPLALACRRALPTRLAATASRRTTTPIGPVRLPLGLASHLHRQPRGPLLLSITLASPTTRSLTHTVSLQLPFVTPLFLFFSHLRPCHPSGAGASSTPAVTLAFLLPPTTLRHHHHHNSLIGSAIHTFSPQHQKNFSPPVSTALRLPTGLGLFRRSNLSAALPIQPCCRAAHQATAQSALDTRLPTLQTGTTFTS